VPKDIVSRLGQTHFPGSLGHLERASRGSPAREFYAQLAWQDVVWQLDDFTGDTINLDPWAVGETGAGTQFAIPSTHLVGGAITGVTGTTTGNCETLRGARVWSGDYGCFMEVRCKVDVVTTLSMEIGFIDSASDLTLPAVSDVDTPAFAGGTSDAAVLHIDTSQTLTTMAFVTDGSTANMNATATTLSPVFTPTAATYHTYRVGISGDNAWCYVDGGRHVSHGTLIGSRTEGGTLVRPFIAVRTRTGAAKTLDIDYVLLAGGRRVRVA